MTKFEIEEAICVPTETHDLSTEIEPQSHENDFLD